MKKFYALAIAIALLSFAGLAQAAVAVSEDGTYVGEAVKLDAGRALNTSFDGYDTVTFLANGHKDGVTTNVSSESTLTNAALAYGVMALEIGKAKTIGLDDGVKGQMITLICTVKDLENAVISKTAFPATTHSTGWSTITFDTQLDSITLLWISDTYGWVVIGNNGCTIT
uniref:Uncharacterized protein n=1 Tax=viral metagenome TaxID=1070528 RepID=A0A6H2A1V4_9ZZZZ